jgi:hypothetical protein
MPELDPQKILSEAWSRALHGRSTTWSRWLDPCDVLSNARRYLADIESYTALASCKSTENLRGAMTKMYARRAWSLFKGIAAFTILAALCCGLVSIGHFDEAKRQIERSGIVPIPAPIAQAPVQQDPAVAPTEDSNPDVRARLGGYLVDHPGISANEVKALDLIGGEK